MKTKKITLTILTILFTTILFACQQHREYQVGDIVTIKGVIYELVDFNNTEQYSPFSFATKDEEQTIHSYYYYDMVDEARKEIIPYEDFYKDPNRNPYALDEYFESVSKASDVGYPLQEDQYFSLKYYVYSFFGFDKSTGFVVKGYNGDNDHVSVVDSIADKPVMAIGYRAFKGALMSRLTVNSCVLVLPESISECPNLTYIDFTKGCSLFSKAISRNPKLEEVTSVYRLSDACFYDLPSLRIVDINGSLPESWPIASINYDIDMGGCVYKAPLYLCPNVRIFGENTITRNNVVYDARYRMVGSGIAFILHVMDDYIIDVNDVVFYSGILDKTAMTILPSYLNTGHDLNGSLVGGKNGRYYREDGKLFAHLGGRNAIFMQYLNNGGTEPVLQIIQSKNKSGDGA